MDEGSKVGKREMSLKESVEQIMSTRDSLPQHVKVVAEWNRAILEARRAPAASSDPSKR